jgi:hypothetical protein
MEPIILPYGENTIRACIEPSPGRVISSRLLSRRKFAVFPAASLLIHPLLCHDTQATAAPSNNTTVSLQSKRMITSRAYCNVIISVRRCAETVTLGPAIQLLLVNKHLINRPLFDKLVPHHRFVQRQLNVEDFIESNFACPVGVEPVWAFEGEAACPTNMIHGAC